MEDKGYFIFIDSSTNKSLGENNIEVLTLFSNNPIQSNIPCNVTNASNIEDRVSLLTINIINYINSKISRLFDNPNYMTICTSSFLNKDEHKYVEHYVNELLKNDTDISNNAYPINANQDVKYYDIKPLNKNNFLVIFEPGFITYLMESKDNLSKFILNCLHLLYDYNLDIQPLIKTYLSIQMQNMNFFKLKI